jgi:drug/metabolite transporter (DMT)-like permease
VLGAALSAVIATQLNLEALKREELSYTAPLNAFVSIFTLIIAAVFLGESPPKFGIVGILIIVLGAYIINIKPDRVKWYDPLVHLAKNTGARLSLAVALGYAVNTVLFKLISNEGHDSFSILYATTIFGWLLLVYVPFVKQRELKAALRSNKFVLFGAAVSSFAGSFFHILAVAGTYASYAVSVRRFEVLFSVLLGWRFLKEINIRNKVIGSLCMVVGAILMAVL